MAAQMRTLPREMLLRLTREASVALSVSTTTRSLRELCRRFLSQHKSKMGESREKA